MCKLCLQPYSSYRLRQVKIDQETNIELCLSELCSFLKSFTVREDIHDHPDNENCPHYELYWQQHIKTRENKKIQLDYRPCICIIF